MAVRLRFTSFSPYLVLGALFLAGCAKEQAGSPEAKTAKLPDAPRSLPAPADTRPVIAAFGDSLSAGFGLDPGKSFPEDVQRRLDAAGYHYRVVNMGVSGDTTTDGLERISSVLALKPAVVILEFGGNDGLRGQPVVSTRHNLAQMIEALRTGGSAVLLAGMTLPRNYGPEYIHSFEQMYVSLAQEYNVPRIPFLLDQVAGIESLMQPDGIHPNAEGAHIVAATVMQYLPPLLHR